MRVHPGIAATLSMLGSAGLAWAAEDGPCPLTLVDRAARAGIDFVHDSGASGGKHLPETMGSGVAWLDWDGDGWLDLYLVQSGPFPPDGSAAAQNRLYRNLGVTARGAGGASADASPRFEDVTERAAAGDRGYGQGVLAADFDGDGDADLWVGNFGADVILWNDRDAGRARFERRALHGGVEEASEARNWSSSAAAADADGDGDLDLYVARYLDYDPAHGLFCGELGKAAGEERRDYCDPSLFLGQPDRFYRNLVRSGDGRGARGFEEVAAAAGLVDTEGKGLGVVFTDLDGDGDPDVYVANDLTLNLTFRNRLRDESSVARGTDTPRQPAASRSSSASPSTPALQAPLFEDVTLFSGAAVNRAGKPEAGMGVVAEDFDNDGDPDLAVTNFDVETNTLYENQGGLLFEDIAAQSGFGPPSFNLLGFGLVGADLDLDGALDAYVANGHIFEHPRRDNTSYRQPDLLLRGDGRGRFGSTPCALAAQAAAVARGAAAADYDRDGDVDLLVTHSDDVPFLLENRVRGPANDAGRTSTGSAGSAAGPAAAASPHFVSVELLGQPPNSQAIGAALTLVHGSSRQHRQILAGDSYQSSSDRRQIFGIPAQPTGGAPPPPVLEIRWPSGHRQRIAVPRLDTHLLLAEPRTSPAIAAGPPAPSSSVPAGLDRPSVAAGLRPGNAREARVSRRSAMFVVSQDDVSVPSTHSNSGRP